MHPALDELIALEDGERRPEAQAHLEACPECRAEVARIRVLRSALRSLPAQPARQDLWPAAAARLRSGRRNRWLLWGSAAAAVLLAAALGVSLLSRPGVSGPATAAGSKAASAAPADPKVAALITQSQALEQVLKQYESDSSVMTSRSAGAIADLQDRVALIDLQIGMAEDGSTGVERLQELWKYRVQLLASLVEIHRSRGAYTRI